MIFNGTIMEYNIEDTLKNFTSFFDEVVVATVKSKDDTRERLSKLENLYSNLKVVDTDVKIDGNNRFDGQLKTIAMNKCTNPIRCIADFDERFILSQRPIWDKAAERLMQVPYLDGVLIPVLDLYKDKFSIRADQQIGQKFRLHKASVIERGVPRFAELGGGLFSASKSDSTDPLNSNKDLCNFCSLIDPIELNPVFAQNLKNFPFVVHLGVLDLARRIRINKEFWQKKWKEYDKEARVSIDIRELDNKPSIKHNLDIGDLL